MVRRKFYDFGPVLSYNAIYNFIAGGRGIGKTYGAKKRVLKAFIKTGEQFIYLRRYKTEVAASRDTFFADIAHEFPNHDFRIFGSKAQISEAINEDSFSDPEDLKKARKNQVWQTAGYFIALSTAQTRKGSSYPRVTTIIFDEFIIEKGSLHYLPNETDAFNNFYSTVDRYRKTNEVRVLFLANSVSIMNPYFIKFDIIPDDGSGEFMKRSNGFIVAHFPDSAEFAKDIYTTRFGQFIKDTDYGDFAVGNVFHDNDTSLIAVKGSRAKYRYTVETAVGRFSVWYDGITNQYYVQEKDNKSPLIFTLVPEKMSENKTLMSVRDKPLAYLRAGFNAGRVMFDKPATRNTLREIFKR